MQPQVELGEGYAHGKDAEVKVRLETLPDVPAIGEVIKDYDAIGWYGLGAPAKTSPEIVKKLSEAMNAAIAVPKVKERFIQLGVEVGRWYVGPRPG